MKTKYINIGKTRKAHGTHGSIRLDVPVHYHASLQLASAIFISVAGSQVPFFVEKWISEDPLVVKLEEVASREAAAQISNKEIFLRKEDINVIPEEEQADMLLLRGYIIFDEKAGEVGMVDQVIELPQQIMAIVRKEEREIFIPLNETFVRQIDPEQKHIYMELPDGLLDLY